MVDQKESTAAAPHQHFVRSTWPVSLSHDVQDGSRGEPGASYSASQAPGGRPRGWAGLQLEGCLPSKAAVWTWAGLGVALGRKFLQIETTYAKRRIS